MKKIFLLATSVLFVITVNAQTDRKASVKDANDRYANIEVAYAGTTTKLPKGVMLRNGRLVIKIGYNTIYTDNNQVINVQKKNGVVTGSFTCYCKVEGTCAIRNIVGTVNCVSDGCNECDILVTINPKQGVAITKAGSNWKKLVIKNRPITEDPDQGGEIIKTKQDVLPSKQ